MSSSKDNQSNDLFLSMFGVAKKLSSSGIDVLNKVGQNSANKNRLNTDHLIDGAQDVLREHLPHISKQVFGRHYYAINKVSHFVAPNLSDKVSGYLFHQLNQLSSQLSSVDAVLDEAGVRDLEDLTQDVARSRRISEALAEQNKWIASVQGAFSGATGVMGSAIDVPASLILSLRSIYQIGRAYGFELNQDTGQDMVQFIFKQIDLGLIAEKQTLLMTLKALSNTLQYHDLSQLQQLLGSHQDADILHQWLSTDKHEPLKQDWFDYLPKFGILAKLTPLASASLSAAYSWKLLDDVNQKAQIIFSEARAYLQQHKNMNISPILAYEKSRELLVDAAPKLFGQLHIYQIIKLDDHAWNSKLLFQFKKRID